MSRLSMLYSVFCLGIIALFVVAARDGYSPFADGGARGMGRSAVIGPTHK